MKKKAKLQILFICCLLLPQLVFADDGKLKLDTDIITNGTQENNNANLIESKYAPNLFLNRTKKRWMKEIGQLKSYCKKQK